MQKQETELTMTMTMWIINLLYMLLARHDMRLIMFFFIIILILHLSCRTLRIESQRQLKMKCDYTSSVESRYNAWEWFTFGSSYHVKHLHPMRAKTAHKNKKSLGVIYKKGLTRNAWQYRLLWKEHWQNVQERETLKILLSALSAQGCSMNSYIFYIFLHHKIGMEEQTFLINRYIGYKVVRICLFSFRHKFLTDIGSWL